MNAKKIILIILSLLVIWGLWSLITRNTDIDSNNTQMGLIDGENGQEVNGEENQNPVVDDWIRPYLKEGLTDTDKQDLAVILEQRKERLQQMKNILDEAYDNGDMEQAWSDVQKMREKCQSRIAPYIAEDKLSEFNLYCYNQAEEMDSNYVQK